MTLRSKILVCPALRLNRKNASVGTFLTSCFPSCTVNISTSIFDFNYKYKGKNKKTGATTQCKFRIITDILLTGPR
jgi:hypothetical protein